MRPSLPLPQEITEEILGKLPVKLLLRFRCVSKSWRRLIGSDGFIKLQMQKSRDDKTLAHWRVIFNYWDAGLKQCSMRSFLDEPSIDPSPIEDPTNNNSPVSGHIVDSCNGVVCIIKKLGFFILFNPATKIFHPVPELCIANLSPGNKYGFGWDETSSAYKVFTIMLDKGNNRKGSVYSTKARSWKTIEHEVLHSRGYGNGKLACGKTHWLTKSVHATQIESFDLKSEVFGVIELPFIPELNSWLIETDGCLGVCSYNEETRLYDVWVMKEYGVKESWVKETRLAPHRNITSRRGSHFYFESLVSPDLS